MMSLSKHIEQAMLDAIEYLAIVLEWKSLVAPTHHTLIVRGWDKDETTRRAIARYLVGLRACAIDAALDIRAHLEDTESDRVEILQNVETIVRKDNAEIPGEKRPWKTYERNPWLAEGIGHLCLAIAGYCIPDLHPPGNVIALNYAHVLTKDHGLDVAAVYQVGDLIGLSMVESKAYADVNDAMSRATEYFQEVNDGIHAVRIRDTVEIMRASFSKEVNACISASFWKRKRAYLPNPHYDIEHDVVWTHRRPSLANLQVEGVDAIWVLPNAIAGFDGFFDAIADEMRAFARSLVNV